MTMKYNNNNNNQPLALADNNRRPDQNFDHKDQNKKVVLCKN